MEVRLKELEGPDEVTEWLQKNLDKVDFINIVSDDQFGLQYKIWYTKRPY